MSEFESGGSKMAMRSSNSTRTYTVVLSIVVFVGAGMIGSSCQNTLSQKEYSAVESKVEGFFGASNMDHRTGPVPENTIVTLGLNKISSYSKAGNTVDLYESRRFVQYGLFSAPFRSVTLEVRKEGGIRTVWWNKSRGFMYLFLGCLQTR